MDQGKFDVLSLITTDPARKRFGWEDRLISHIWIGEGCWAWSGWRNQDGYGAFKISPEEAKGGQLTVLPYRYIYTLMVGPIPEGYQVDHRCRNRTCCNHEHLEAVTHQVNLFRARRHLCKRGHMLSGENRMSAGIYRGRERWRCRSCYEERLAADRAARLARGHKKPGRKKISSDQDVA